MECGQLVRNGRVASEHSLFYAWYSRECAQSGQGCPRSIRELYIWQEKTFSLSCLLAYFWVSVVIWSGGKWDLLYRQRKLRARLMQIFARRRSQIRFFQLWPVRLGVRTPPFHGGNTGSNPVPVTISSQTFSLYSTSNLMCALKITPGCVFFVFEVERSCLVYWAMHFVRFVWFVGKFRN